MTRALAPRYWGGHLLALVLVGTALWLGGWQFEGWQERRAAEARDLTRVAPVPLADALGPDEPFPGDAVGRPVVVEGTWLPGGTVYVSGRTHGDREGFWAVTPLAVGGPDEPALPVVRGWLASVDDAPAPPTGEAELVAWLQPPEGAVGVVDDDPADDVIPQVRVADLVQRVDQDLYGGYGVVADRVAPGDWPVGEAAVNPGTDGLAAAQVEETPDVGRFTALRNFFYGVEWWVFGAFAAFVWWSWLRDRLRAERAGPAGRAGRDGAAGEAAGPLDEEPAPTP